MRPHAEWNVRIQIARATAPSMPFEPLAHLARRLVRERDREDLVRLHALRREQVRDAVREDARLAGAGAGDHEQRPFGREDGLALGGIQVCEVALGRGDGHRSMLAAEAEVPPEHGEAAEAGRVLRRRRGSGRRADRPGRRPRARRPARRRAATRRAKRHGSPRKRQAEVVEDVAGRHPASSGRSAPR